MRTTIDREERHAHPELFEPAKPADRPRGGYVWGVLRILLGWVFLWAFLDKAFALGFANGRNAETGVTDYFGPTAWINGGHPTEGFLKFGTKGPFADAYQGLAGQAWVDWVYMLSMLLIGLALITGIAVRPAAVGGIVWMGLFYTAGSIWPDNNPFVDDHIVYAVVLAGIAVVGAGKWLGLGERWARTRLVRRWPILE